jgi:cyanophycinase
VRWFRELGALSVQALPIVDDGSANDPFLSKELHRSDLIFILGGFPGYLAETLKDSLCWDAITKAEQCGGIIAGSSAGAMVLCEHYFDPVKGKNERGMDLIHNACVLPHHNTFGRSWIRHLEKTLPDAVLIGIDEETAMINESRNNVWHAYGRGAATLYRNGHVNRFTANQRFEI